MHPRLHSLLFAASALVIVFPLYPDVGDEYWEGGLDHSFLGPEAYPLAPAHLAESGLWEVVSGQNGRVKVEKANGKRSAIAHPRLGLVKGEQFAGGMVQVVASAVEPVERAKAGAAVNSGFYTTPRAEYQTAVSLTLRSSEDYRDVSVGMLFFNETGGHELYVVSVGSLDTGEERRLAFHIPVAFDTSRAAVNYAVLLFSPEGEIVTEGRRRMTPFLNNLFESFYSELVYVYQKNSGSDSRPVSLVQQYPVVANLDTIELPPKAPVYFTLSVNERGFVDGVESSEELPRELYAACERSFREWLFLPKLENGYPRSSRVRIPVSF